MSKLIEDRVEEILENKVEELIKNRAEEVYKETMERVEKETAARVEKETIISNVLGMLKLGKLTLEEISQISHLSIGEIRRISEGYAV